MYAFPLCNCRRISRRRLQPGRLFPDPRSLLPRPGLTRLYMPSCPPVDLEIRGRRAFVSAGIVLARVAEYGRLRVEPVETPNPVRSCFPCFHKNSEEI